MTTLLIDADGVAFTAAAAVQHGIRWDDDIYTTHADMGEAKEAFEATVEAYRDAVGADAEVVLCFSCPSRRYFRHDLLPTYKANRKGDTPLVYRDLREWASEQYPTKVKPHLEADDVVGILATHPKLISGEKVIVSADKDLQQIPGLHLSAQRPSEGVFRVTPKFAETLLWTQALTGDAVDNYTGIPGVGPVKAARILGTDPNEFVDRAIEAYLKAGLTEEEFTTQVNVARILKADAYNFKRKEPILWRMT